MAVKKKRTSAGKKPPEQEIISMAHRVSDYIAERRNMFLAAAVVLVLAVVVFAGIAIKRSLDERSAGPLFSDAYSLYSAPPLSGGLIPDYQKALDKFRSIAKQYPSATSGILAQYYTANCLMNLGRNDEALKEYRSFVDKHGSDKFLAGLAYARMGYLFRSLGNQPEAIKAFEQAETLMGPGIPTFELAKMYEVSGNDAEAQKKYKIIAKKLAGTEWAMEARAKIEKIQAPAGAAANKPKAAK